MKKKILVVTLNSSARMGLQAYLSSVFQNYLFVDAILATQASPASFVDTAAVLYSSADVETICHSMVPEGVKELVCIRTFNHTYLHKVLEIPPGSFVYLVNDSEKNTYEVIRQLQDFGITQYHFLPFYPGCGPVSPEIKYAVTTGESHLVPKSIPHVVDLGNRLVDISTINQVISWFKLPTSLADGVTRNYINHIVQILKLSNTQLSQTLDTRLITQTIINTIVNGICLVGSDSAVQMVNRPFCSMIGIPERDLMGQRLLPWLERCQGFDSLKAGQEQLLYNPKGEPIRLWTQEIDTSNSSRLYLIHAYRSESGTQDDTGEGRTAKSYGFDRILTQTPSVEQMVDHAKRISLNDFHVIIQGESGTEREILAQSIHNNSRRHDGPFVPLRITALDPSQMATELLGREEMTPEGKMAVQTGILEAADKGALFVDNIHRLPLPMQNILWGALQNGFVKRIGGSEAVRVNFRVIASTSVDLYAMVKSGGFLEDLFFAISANFLYTVPLKDRPDDLPLLLEHFLRNMFADSHIQIQHVLSQPLQEFLKTYSWPGNVHELGNLCRHFSSAYNRQPLTLQNLPPYILETIKNAQPPLTPGERQILELIKETPHLGRAGMAKRLGNSGIQLSEGRLRTILNSLSEAGFIKIHRTRGGCEITELGLTAIIQS